MANKNTKQKWTQKTRLASSERPSLKRVRSSSSDKEGKEGKEDKEEQGTMMYEKPTRTNEDKVKESARQMTRSASYPSLNEATATASAVDNTVVNVDPRPSPAIPEEPSPLSDTVMMAFYEKNKTQILKDLGLCDISSDITELKSSIDYQDEVILSLKMENEELKHRLAITEGELIRTQKQVASMSDSITDLTARSMKDNIIVKNLPEEKNEDMEKRITSFLKAELAISEEDMGHIRLDRVHRMGKYTSGRTRHTVVKLNSKGKDIVKRHLKNLGSECNIKVTDQIPPEVQEKRNKLWPMYSAAKQSGDKPQWIQDKLKIGSRTISAPLDKVRDINSDPIEAATKVKPKHTPVTSEEGSHFQGHSVDIATPDDVIPALKALAADTRVAGATHMIYAYRTGTDNHAVSNWHDDREWGAGRRIMNVLEKKGVYNKLICVTRWCGQKLLGGKRFDIIQSVAEKALNEPDL